MESEFAGKTGFVVGVGVTDFGFADVVMMIAVRLGKLLDKMLSSVE